MCYAIVSGISIVGATERELGEEVVVCLLLDGHAGSRSGASAFEA